MVKTLLQQLVKLKGRRLIEALQALGLPPLQPGTNAPPTLITYIGQLLGQHLQEDVQSALLAPRAAPAAPALAALVQASEYRNLQGPLSLEQIRRHLTAIFRCIGEPSSLEQGTVDLYCLTATHPEVEIESYLSRTPAAFQAMLKQRLATLAREVPLARTENLPAPAPAPRPAGLMAPPPSQAIQAVRSLSLRAPLFSLPSVAGAPQCWRGAQCRTHEATGWPGARGGSGNHLGQPS